MREPRKTGAVDQDGHIVIISRLSPVTGSNKSPGSKRRSPAEHLLGLSLDRMHDYLSWPPDGLDPHRPAAQTQVIRLVAMVATKLGAEARREQERAATLEALARSERLRP
jgi:hypothetical protein